MTGHMRVVYFVAAVRLTCDDAANTDCWRLEKLAIDNRIGFGRETPLRSGRRRPVPVAGSPAARRRGLESAPPGPYIIDLPAPSGPAKSGADEGPTFARLARDKEDSP